MCQILEKTLWRVVSKRCSFGVDKRPICVKICSVKNIWNVVDRVLFSTILMILASHWIHLNVDSIRNYAIVRIVAFPTLSFSFFLIFCSSYYDQTSEKCEYQKYSWNVIVLPEKHQSGMGKLTTASTSSYCICLWFCGLLVCLVCVFDSYLPALVHYNYFVVEFSCYLFWK